VRALGIDYGLRRIGLALSDASGTLASPLGVLMRPKSERDTLKLVRAEVARLAAEVDGLAAVVVGWPRRLDGSPNDQTPIVETFARALGAALTVPVVLQDERLTSHEADERLATGERDWKKRKLKLDAAPRLRITSMRGRVGKWIGRLALFALLAAAAGPRVVAARAATTPFRARRQAVFVDVPPGTGPLIGARLVAAGVVRDDLTFRVALWLTGRARDLKAGEYRFDGAKSAVEVVTTLADGAIYTRPVTSASLTIPRWRMCISGLGARTRSSRRRARVAHAIWRRPTSRNTSFPDTYPVPRRRAARGADGAASAPRSRPPHRPRRRRPCAR
jgi:putative transcription antitermination factor YqgF